MEIRQITYFLALCEELHFTRAARRCGVAQPSLTNAIRALEQEFGALLFHRKPRPHLTALGLAVRPELARVLAHVDNALAHGQHQAKVGQAGISSRRAPARRRSARPVRGAELARPELVTRA